MVILSYEESDQLPLHQSYIQSTLFIFSWLINEVERLIIAPRICCSGVCIEMMKLAKKTECRIHANRYE